MLRFAHREKVELTQLLIAFEVIRIILYTDFSNKIFIHFFNRLHRFLIYHHLNFLSFTLINILLAIYCHFIRVKRRWNLSRSISSSFYDLQLNLRDKIFFMQPYTYTQNLFDVCASCEHKKMLTFSIKQRENSNILVRLT